MSPSGTTIGTTVTQRARPAESRMGLRARRKTRLLARPGGAVLTTISLDDAVLALAEPSGGYRRVEYAPPCAREFAYVGFVREGDLDQPNYGQLIGCGRGGGQASASFGEFAAAPRIAVAAGRFLLDTERPQVVGCVRAATELPDLGDGRVAVPTLWGPLQVRLAPEGFTGPCRR